ncbi:MAG: flagellar basal body rod protein FlgB [Oscillospiraceae bacterium]|jgi:flagellar basal-body rod protein FlgB|nr:flagellar basal body rod protein FlgB [Oscillospiraceae bacterium]
MWDRLFQSVDLLGKGLSAAWMRNTAIRSNIANVETPGYKAQDVEFETLFENALSSTSSLSAKKTNPKHQEFDTDVSSVSAVLIDRDDGTAMRLDGNNVDIDSENVKLAQNTIQYNTILAKLNSELARIRMAVNDGR